MTDIFLKLIGQLNSSVFVLLAILILSYWLTAKVSRLGEQFSQHRTKIKKIDELSESLVAVRLKVDLIYQNTNPNKTVAAFSPIALTPAGVDIANRVKAEALFKKYAPRLVDMVEEESPSNAYDVQTVAMRVAREKMMNLLNANEINTVKAEAYSRGMLVEDVMSIFGVLLRDCILEKRGIAVAQVDTDDPAKGLPA